jgi:hypothetical protein
MPRDGDTPESACIAHAIPDVTAGNPEAEEIQLDFKLGSTPETISSEQIQLLTSV